MTGRRLSFAAGAGVLLATLGMPTTPAAWACSPEAPQGWVMPAEGATGLPLNAHVFLHMAGCWEAGCPTPEITFTRMDVEAPVSVTTVSRLAAGGLWGYGAETLVEVIPDAPLEALTNYELSAQGDGWAPLSTAFTTGDATDEAAPVLAAADISGAGGFVPTDNFCYGDHYSYHVTLPPGAHVVYEIAIDRGADQEPLGGTFAFGSEGAAKDAWFDLSTAEGETLPTPEVPCFIITAIGIAGHVSEPVTVCEEATTPPSDAGATDEDVSASDAGFVVADDLGPTTGDAAPTPEDATPAPEDAATSTEDAATTAPAPSSDTGGEGSTGGGGGEGSTGGEGSGGDGEVVTSDDTGSSSGGCDASGGTASWLLALMLLGLVALRRRAGAALMFKAVMIPETDLDLDGP
ncbi:MAG: MYXO-CTERM sorting domain-containing protein [Myxococcota bacterium]|nr:MYXO-CTERM sorting domain-containing protein [Myxococcota bacterium]